MKKLKKILLINWLYFSKQIIEVGDVNFLTGKNGAGKSTVIDALQIVLLGETNARNFNQAANEKSQRSLDGYLRADMDDNNPYSRRGKDFSSYIACEFLDDVEGTRFVTGVVFDCRSDGNNIDHFFIYDGEIPEDGFVENGFALDYTDFRKRMKEKYGLRAKFYDTQSQYRTDMLAKWNVHNEQVTRMMKKAVSFRPIVDIQKFITENICDIPDKPNIVEMQQNIRDYKRHEQLAQRQEEKLTALQEIGRLFREMQLAIDRWQQQSFLVLWAQKEDLEAENNKGILEQKDCEERIQKVTSEIERVSLLIRQKKQRKEELIAACAQSDVSREEEKLRRSKESLLTEQQRLLRQLQNEVVDVKREAATMSSLCQTILGWDINDVLHSVIDAADTIQKAYSLFTDCNYEIFAKSIAIFARAQDATANFMAAVRDTAYKVKVLTDDLKAEQDQKAVALDNLRKNVKDYPRGLLRLKERLEVELTKKAGKSVTVDILADVLEIPESEEHWRRAVEGYLNTQKFYLLVPPEYYRDALRIYDQIKRDFGMNSFGLVDIGKLRERERLEPRSDSLAKKVETENDLARSYIDYLLGRVVCCSHVDQLRRSKTAITADGMLYQGYVVRPIRKELMDDAFIGRRAVALRIARIEAELTDIQSQLQIWAPIYQTLSRYQNHEVLFSARYIQSVVPQRQTDYLRGLEISSELKQIEEQMSHLDLFWLGEQRKIIAKLDGEIDSLGDSKEQYITDKALRENRIHALVWDILPEINQKIANMEDRITEEFSEDFIQKTGIPRYQQELR